MGLFSRKPHVQLEEFCTDFFDNQILSPQIAGIEASKVLFDSVKNSVAEVSPAFATVDDELLGEELLLLRFEMFGLALLHRCGDEIAHHESRFTKDFLKLRGREDIWKNLINYNQIVSKSAVYEFDATTEAGKWGRLKMDKMKMDEFDKWVTAGFDGETVARVVNRRGSEKSWKNNITPPYLAWKLTERLVKMFPKKASFVLPHQFMVSMKERTVRLMKLKSRSKIRGRSFTPSKHLKDLSNGLF